MTEEEKDSIRLCMIHLITVAKQLGELIGDICILELKEITGPEKELPQ